MKKFASCLITVVLLGSTFSALSATEIRKGDVAQYKKTDSVSVEIPAGTVEDITNALSSIADKNGADFFLITACDTAGKGGMSRGEAILYSK
ncbi:DUF1471 domain-containing protein [Salmonella enterica]|nr:DUF1471 domain-containing protein [Salmonella enterica]ECC4608425.1 DUF1471 domain-containing protein [Salmonella enterica]ECR4999206.1 DUF1471 domain-containing protein [Salmonella enterica]EGO9987199.1 DUF1471 domain-containing protein [Salmonella enterica]EIF5468759.1 DUF1471 domain-containing protein [Salmonella enterica]